MNLHDFFQYLTPETLAYAFQDIAKYIEKYGELDDAVEARDAIFEFVSSGFFTEHERFIWMQALGRPR